MDDKQRTKILGGVLAGVLGIGFVGPAIWDSVMAPVNDARNALARANDDLEKAEVQERKLMVARNHIDDAQMASLPPNPLDAQRVYKEWLTNLAIQCRFGGPNFEVNPGVRPQTLPDMYTSVGIQLDGETDLEGLSRFLHLFEQADLVHRIENLTVESSGTQGNPRLEVSLSAVGLSVNGTSDRRELFARSELTDALPADGTELTVQNAKNFPQETPFLARLGTEMVRVNSVDGNTWTVERGIEGTKPVEHAADTALQHFPVAWHQRDASFDDFATLLAGSPFTKPSPPRTYRPTLTAVSDTTIAPGDEVTMTAKIDDLNQSIGEPQFALETEVADMAIDPETGEIKWSAADDIEPGDYKATVKATQKNNSELQLTKEFTVTVKLPNAAPSLTAPEEAIVVLDREFILTVDAEDDGPREDLNFELAGDSIPADLAVDSSSGVIKWKPPLSFSPGEYTVEVKVTDSGDPAKSATATVKLKVKDDSAVQTYLTAAVSKDGVLEAWFYNRGANKRFELHAGDELKIDDIDAEIIKIEKRAVHYRDTMGLWRLPLGKNLRDSTLIEAAVDVAEEKKTEAADSYDADPPKDAGGTSPATTETPDAVSTHDADASVSSASSAGRL